ncbi:MAG TPA: CoA ester lyase [Candidatus Limnocylindria bacterium]
MPTRSLMFVPGHRKRMVERALGLGEFEPTDLDLAILDLEDGVPPAAKADARAIISSALAAARHERPARFVRVNRGPAERDADLAGIVTAGLDGVVAPKVDEPAELAALGEALEAAERAAGLPARVPVIASIESARGLTEARAIAESSERVVALLFGAEDFARDLSLPSQREGEARDLLYARSAVVVAAVAARRLAFDGIWPDVRDIDGLRRDAIIGRRLGFHGKSVVHPDHVATVNEVFGPSPDDTERARRIVEAFEGARAAGEGAVLFEGSMLDEPIVERARRTLELARAIAGRKRTPPVERPAALEGKRLK